MYFIFAFPSLLSILLGIMSSAIGLTFCDIAVGIQEYTSIIKKNKKKHDKLILTVSIVSKI